jgi:hypothetical protein
MTLSATLADGHQISPGLQGQLPVAPIVQATVDAAGFYRRASVEDRVSHDLMRLTEALYHLRAFGEMYLGNDLVDERSGLTAEDLSFVVRLLERIQATAASTVIVPRPRQ